MVRSLQKLASMAQSAEGAEVAAAHRNSRPLPPQGERPGSTWSGNTAGLVVTAVILGVMVAAVVISIVAGPESTGNGNVAPELRTGCAVAGVLLAAVSIWGWRRYWLIADTPTVEIAGAHPGLCELTGTARPLGDPVASWFTGAPVLWYHAMVERRGTGDRDGKWHTIWHHTEGSRQFLLVGDDGATIDVDATGAVLDGDRLIVRHDLDRKHKITENAVVAGDRLYVLGSVQLCEDGHLQVAKESGRWLRRPPLWVSQRGETRVRRRLRRSAVAATALSMGLAALVTAVEEVPSDDPEFDTELVMRQDGALLVPALTVAGLIAAGYLLAYLWRLWNRLIGLRNQAAYAWSLIDVAAARRHATIANLAAITEAAAAHERSTHTQVATRRARLPATEAVGRVDAELAVDNSARSAIVARVEAIPNLSTDEVFTTMFQELIATENRVAAARRFYNDAVTELTDRTSTFPGILLRQLVSPTLPPLLAFDPNELRPPIPTA